MSFRKRRWASFLPTTKTSGSCRNNTRYFEQMSRLIGFSTGAIAKGDFRRALQILSATNIRVVELSALRLHELKPLCDALPTLDLNKYEFVSVHAPSCFSAAEEPAVVSLLKDVTT